MRSKSQSKLKAKDEEIIKEPTFIVKMICNNEVYEATGDDLLELIVNFTPPAVIKNETRLTVTKGNKIVDKNMKVFEARRMFNNKISMLLFTKNLLTRLG